MSLVLTCFSLLCSPTFLNLLFFVLIFKNESFLKMCRLLQEELALLGGHRGEFFQFDDFFRDQPGERPNGGLFISVSFYKIFQIMFL